MSFHKLYLSFDQAPSYTPATIRGAWDDVASLVTRKAITGPASSGSATLGNAYAIENGTNTQWDMLLLRAVTDPLAAQTISGTLTLALLAAMQPWPDMLACWHLHAYATVGDTDVVRGTILNDFREADPNLKYPSTMLDVRYASFKSGILDGATLFAAAALSSTAIQAGDRLVIEIGAVARNSYAGFSPGVRMVYGENVADQDVLFEDEGTVAGAGGHNNGYLFFSNAISLLVEPTPVATITKDDEWRGEPQIAWVDFFHKDVDGNAHTFHWSELPVAGPSYYLEPRAIQLGVCERKASERGQLEGSTFTFQVADTDNTIRAFLGNANQIALYDVEVVVKLERIVDFMAGLDPIVAFRGLVKKYKPTGRTFSFECQDWLSSRIGQDIVLPVAAADFPGTPAANRERVGPLLYGAISDEGSTGDGPVNAAESASETHDNVAGYGELGGTPPTGTAAADAGATGTLNGEYFVMATTVKDGIESDPFPFYGVDTLGGSPASVTVAAGHAITASCDNMGAAADTYRFYLCYFSSGYRWEFGCWVESATPSVTFTSLDPTVQAGGHAGFVALWNYAASYLYADGETALGSGVTTSYVGLARGFRRPIRCVFVGPAPVGVVGMRIYRKPALGDYDRVWTIPLSQVNGGGNLYFDDDLLDTGVTYITGAPTPVGTLAPFYVGEFTALDGSPWSGFAIAGHPCADPAVINVYVDQVAVNPGRYGVNIAAPGQAGFATLFGATTYRVGATGQRWTLLYLSGSDAADIVAGTKTLGVNVHGVEEVGDGSGALIESLNYQAQHFARNFVMCDQAWAGDVDWFGMPTWADGEDRIDDVSFDVAETKAELHIGDTAGARALLTVRALLDILAEMAVDADTAYGFTRVGKFKWFLEDPDPFASAAATIDEIQDTKADSFDTTDETDPVWFHNVMPYEYGPGYDASGGVALAQKATLTDVVSQLRYGKNGKKRVIPLTTPVQFFGRKNAASVAAVMHRYRARHANPPRHVDQQLGMFWFLREIGDVVGITNSEGVAAAGWTDELVRVRQIAADFGPWIVQMRCRQLSTALLVTLSTYLVEEFMSDIDLGGVWAGSPADLTTAASQTVLPVEYRDRLVQWPVVPATAVVEAVIFSKVDDAGLTLTPQIFNVTDGAVVVTGSPVTSLTFGAAQTLTVPRPVDDEAKEYRLRATVAGGNTVAEPTRTVGLLGSLRVLFP